MNTSEKKSPLPVYDPEVEGRQRGLKDLRVGSDWTDGRQKTRLTLKTATLLGVKWRLEARPHSALGLHGLDVGGDIGPHDRCFGALDPVLIVSYGFGLEPQQINKY
ncbi:hypothetical protein CRG98_024182 [Punica granatum]|uniref:Uncharacterized protein n=1 Tax=Punica granatum TaxID=22663 RepID=A0A2I0JGN7_PUNGR|nr:hypothetical protein CRG98_024182 [Punica granatum]